ncbi:MAG: ZIP family metal transporter, partial [Gammaproteobacteria bacterium]
MVWLQTLSSVVAVSLLSLSGAAMLMVRDSLLVKAMVVLVPFATGALLGDAFLHMIPEMIEEHDGFPIGTALILIAGVLVFFCLEKVLHWHHAHFPREEMIHPVATSNLVGDALH